MTIKELGAAAAAIVEVGEAGRCLDDLMGRLAGCFHRREPRMSAKRYVRALMSDLPRKNCWTIAEHAGDSSPGKMQHLLGGARWDAMEAMAAVRGLVCDRLEDAGGAGEAVAILDKSGQCKKGTSTAGVKRQYVGCAGRVENAINVVYCSYAAPSGHALVGARLYLPKEWATGPARRRAAGVPEELEFESKGERTYAWAWIGTAGPRHHLLIRRSLTPNAKGVREVAFYLCLVPKGDGRSRCGPWSGSPGAVGRSRRTSKPGRTPSGWTNPRSGPIRRCLAISTVAEVKRLVNLTTRTRHSIEHHLHWHLWRRRHQARARWFHHRNRLARR